MSAQLDWHARGAYSSTDAARIAREVFGGVALLGAAALAVVFAIAHVETRGITSSLPAATLYTLGGLAALGAMTAWLATRHLRTRRFGLANHLTLGRGAIACVLTVLALHPACEPALLGWACTVLATTALVLDFADGYLARRRHTTSAFGARFDMEMDALLALSLSIVVVRSQTVGAWLLAGALLRYVFVLAQVKFPRLRAELPPSQRRRVVCAAHGITLAAVMAPPMPPWLASTACVTAVLAIVYSFATDTLWLLDRPHHAAGRHEPSNVAANPRA